MDIFQATRLLLSLSCFTSSSPFYRYHHGHSIAQHTHTNIATIIIIFIIITLIPWFCTNRTACVCVCVCYFYTIQAQRFNQFRHINMKSLWNTHIEQRMIFMNVVVGCCLFHFLLVGWNNWRNIFGSITHSSIQQLASSVLCIRTCNNRMVFLICKLSWFD